MKTMAWNLKMMPRSFLILWTLSNILFCPATFTSTSKPLYSVSSPNPNDSQLFSLKQTLRLPFYQSKLVTINTNIIHSRLFFSSPLTTMSDSISHSRVSVEMHENHSIDPSCTEIIVVRHGETDWNALGKLQGQLDVDLNEIGRQQAIAVAERLSTEPNISAIYSSDLKRASETAEIIASKFNGLEVLRDQDLRERHLGALQGHVYQELAKLTPKAYEAFKSHRTDLEIPGGGESRDQLYQRSTTALQRIAAKHRGQRVIVVSHGGVIRSLYNQAEAKRQHSGKISNTSIGIIQLSDEGIWSIKSWNDVSHLRQTEFLESAFGGDGTSG